MYLPQLHMTTNLLELVFYTRLIPNMSRASLFISFDWVRIMVVLMHRQSFIQTLLFIVPNYIDFITHMLWRGRAIRWNCDQKLLSIPNSNISRKIATTCFDWKVYINITYYIILHSYTFLLRTESIDKIEFTTRFWRIDAVIGTSLNLIKYCHILGNIANNSWMYKWRVKST